MGETDYKDPDWTDEDFKKLEEITQEFQRKYPNHLTTIRGREWQKKHGAEFARMVAEIKTPPDEYWEAKRAAERAGKYLSFEDWEAQQPK